MTTTRTSSITFSPNDQSLALPITIFHDTSAEIDEKFTLFLMNSEVSENYGVVLMPLSAIITIKEVDGRL